MKPRSHLNGKPIKTLGVVNIVEIKHWDIIKGKSKWANIVFTDSENPVVASHFIFAFTTANLHNILNFEFALLDDQAKCINFPITEDKVTVLNFTI